MKNAENSLKRRLLPLTKMDTVDQILEGFCGVAELRKACGSEGWETDLCAWDTCCRALWKYHPNSLIFQQGDIENVWKDMMSVSFEEIRQETKRQARLKREAETGRPVWTKAAGKKKWAAAFGVSVSTISRWFGPEGKLKNENVSPRKWRILYKDMPADVVARVEKWAE